MVSAKLIRFFMAYAKFTEDHKENSPTILKVMLKIKNCHFIAVKNLIQL